MAARAAPLLAGVVCLLLIVGLSAPTASAQSAPSITLKINQQTVSDGDAIRVSEQPSLDIAVTAETTIDVVTVRVDGQARHSFSPESTEFTESVQLSLEDGRHEIRLVVSTNRTTTPVSVDVLQDRIPPMVSYTSPVTTDRRGPPESVTVGNGTATIAGNLSDATGVDVIYFRVTRRWRHLGTHTTSESFSIEDPGDSFSREFFFGPDPVQNEFEIVYVDGVGNRREHTTTINVSDTQTPTLNVAHPEESSDRVVTVSGSASDNTQLKEAYLEHDGTRHYVLSAPEPAPRPGNQRHRFALDLTGANSLRDGVNEYAMVARDYAGNTQRVDFEIRYVFTVAPIIRLDRDATSLTDDGRVHVAARVDSGEVTSVVLESARPGVDESAHLVNVYSGSPTRRVAVNHTIERLDGPTEVRVRVIDSDGNEHVAAMTVRNDSIEFPPEPSPTTPTPTRTATPGPATTAAPTTSNGGGGGGGSGGTTTAPSGDGGGGDGGGGAAAVTITGGSSGPLPTPGFGVPHAVLAVAILLGALVVARRRR